jgi:hypothetical protein
MKNNWIPFLLIASSIVGILQLFAPENHRKSSGETRHQGGSNKSKTSKSKKRSNKTRKIN